MHSVQELIAAAQERLQRLEERTGLDYTGPALAALCRPEPALRFVPGRQKRAEAA